MFLAEAGPCNNQGSRKPKRRTPRFFFFYLSSGSSIATTEMLSILPKRQQNGERQPLSTNF
jgi:hypothetical protein